MSVAQETLPGLDGNEFFVEPEVKTDLEMIKDFKDFLRTKSDEDLKNLLDLFRQQLSDAQLSFDITDRVLREREASRDNQPVIDGLEVDN